jgi:precorrin-3B C17-methyltransferase
MARHALETSDLIVGYTGYIKLLPHDLTTGREVMATGMRHELDRARMAVAACQSGRNTVVVSSGDAGVYGMAGLILEYLEKTDLLDTVPCTIVPGIPALCAAAALLGAPLMHDFASISLSDLLTPWELILKRIEAAASADFAIVLYNPKSKRRTDQLETALNIIARHQGNEVVVGSVRKAFREGQEIKVARLGDFDVETVDMTTIVLMGNSQTRIAGEKMITPRGYFNKYDLEKGEKGSVRSSQERQRTRQFDSKGDIFFKTRQSSE